MKRFSAALFVLLVAGAALAQSAEYARGGGDVISLPIKQSGSLSGSLSFAFSNAGKSFGGTTGGALIPDRLWFFGTAQRDGNQRFSTLAFPQPSMSLSLHQSQPAFFKQWPRATELNFVVGK